jgi:hypothetical protein
VPEDFAFEQIRHDGWAVNLHKQIITVGAEIVNMLGGRPYPFGFSGEENSRVTWPPLTRPLTVINGDTGGSLV